MNDEFELSSGPERKLALVGGALLLTALCVFAWAAFAPNADEAASNPAGGSTLPLRQPWDVGIAPAGPSSSAVALPVAMSASPMVERLDDEDELPSAPGRVAVCGVGEVDAEEWQAAPRVDLDAARTQVLSSLRAQADDMSQAVAWVIEGSATQPVADEEAPCQTRSCGGEPQRVESSEARRQRLAAVIRPRHELARLAAASRSPDLYAMAWNMCRLQSAIDERSACELLSTAQWAQLDPGNAAPWFELAEQARRSKDRAAVDEFLHRASVAQRFEGGIGRLNAHVLTRLPSTVRPVDGMVLAIELYELEQVTQPLTHVVLKHHCAADKLRDANRRQRCDALAGVLAKHGQTPMQLREAADLGERLGWPSDKTGPLRERSSLALRAAVERLPVASLSCANLGRYMEHLRTMSEFGQLGSLEAPAGPVAPELRQWLRGAVSSTLAVVAQPRVPQSVADASATD